MPHRCTRTNAALLALLAGLIPLSACSDRGADSNKVAEAARALGSVGAVDPASDDTGYATVSAKISGMNVSGDAAAAVTAGLLSQSLQGEGSVAVSKATLSERALFDDLDSVLDSGRRFEAFLTTARTLAAFDPAADLDRIASQTADLERESRETRAERAALAEKIDDLDRRADALRTQSDEKRNRAAEMKLESIGLSATASAARAGTIRTLSREADALDMQISRLSGEATTLRPRLDELDGELAKLAQQIQLAAEAADDLRQMAQERHAEAEVAQANAAQLAEQIRAAVNAIDTDRTDTVIPAGEAATGALERAVRESEKSAREMRTPATLSKASAQRRLAEILHLRAQGHDRYAEMLDILASTESMPNASAFANAAQAERAAARELLQKAADSYDAAASALSSVNLRDADTDRAQETAERLSQIARQIRGDQPAEAPAESQGLNDAEPEGDMP